MQVSFTSNKINHKVIDGLLVVKPTRQDIESLQVGDYAPNCFGKFGKVNEISYRGIDVNGKAYVGYYVQWHGDDSSISESIKEDNIVMTVPLSNKYGIAKNIPY